jgi:hypothetical protein
MLEISTSGLMSGDGKRSGLLGAQPPRPSSTLLKRFSGVLHRAFTMPDVADRKRH